MTYTVIIPARRRSTRLPDKPLLLIEGRPMVVRTAERALMSQASRVVVAVDDDEVEAVVCQSDLPIEVVRTCADHPTGTDRLSEVVDKLGLPDETIIVNLQGDEPLMPPAMLDRVAQLLHDHPACAMATAAHPIASVEDFFNPNVVKVILNHQGEALTFSRAPIPWARDAFQADKTVLPKPPFQALHHLGLYSYRARFLRQYPHYAQAPLEVLESLEQMRALYWGERIAVAVIDEKLPRGVDTLEDLQAVRALWTA